MLYRLLYELRDQSAAFNVFRYITVRAALAAGTAFLLSVVLGPWLIRVLTGRRVTEKTGKSHSKELAEMHKGKRDTPTMGGLLIVVSLLVATLLWADISQLYVQVLLYVTLALCGLGFMDDYIKLTDRERHGVSLGEKLLVQVVLAAAVGVVLYLYLRDLKGGTNFAFPFVKAAVPLGAAYVVLVVFVTVGTCNAVNLADGLDGLAVGCTAMVALTFAGLSYVVGNVNFAGYLLIPYVHGGGECTIYCAGLVGACLGFLWFNCHPAQVFMGDTGALPLGGGLGVVSVIIKQEMVLVIAGGIFVAEALSVLLQILVFRTTGKRLFRCAPLHHHFQFKGWDETKVTVRFWIIGAILGLAAMATLKLR